MAKSKVTKLTKKTATKKTPAKRTRKETQSKRKILITIQERADGSIKAETHAENCTPQDHIILSPLALAAVIDAAIPDQTPEKTIREELTIAGLRAAEMIVSKKREILNGQNPGK